MMFGAGGTAVEVLRDTAHALPPLDLKLARDLMRQTRVWRLLQGYRDRPAADIERHRRGPRPAQLARRASSRDPRDRHQSAAGRRQGGDRARRPGAGRRCGAASPRVPMAIRPYPSEWETEAHVEPMGAVRIRPIRPEDEALYGDFFANVTPDDQRLRFFTAAPRPVAPVPGAADADRLRARDGVRRDRQGNGRAARRGARRRRSRLHAGRIRHPACAPTSRATGSAGG